MTKQAVMDYVGKYKDRIDLAIEQEIDKRLKEVGEISPLLIPIVNAMKELSVGGKRLRGLLTILGYELAGGKVDEEIIKAGAAMEIFHLGLLIQDDVMDRDNLRRGVKTVHFRYPDLHLGESIAMCAGDYTFAWVTEMLLSLKVNEKIKQKSLVVWAKYFKRVGYGQTLDVMAEQRGNTSDEEILKVLMIKSGEYTCVLPLLLGATIVDASEETCENLEKYGMELGWVFQLRDDYLAEYGDSTKTGKPVGNDSREGKKTFATLYGKEKTEEAINKHLELGSAFVNGNEVMKGLLEWMATRDN